VKGPVIDRSPMWTDIESSTLFFQRL